MFDFDSNKQEVDFANDDVLLAHPREIEADVSFKKIKKNLLPSNDTSICYTRTQCVDNLQFLLPS